MFPDKSSWKSTHHILDTTTYEHDLKGFHFVFVELAKFNKSLEQSTTLGATQK